MVHKKEDGDQKPVKQVLCGKKKVKQLKERIKITKQQK